MLKIRINGGLGNQLFQYATAFALAKNNKTEMVVDISEAVNYSVHPLRLTELNCSARFDDKSSLQDKILLHPRLIRFASMFFKQYYIESSLKHDSALQEIANNKLLIGYFQCEKYFKSYRDELLKEFLPKKDFSNYQRSLAEKIKSVNSLSIHIRRGDYIINPDANAIHGVCDKEYFDRAIKYLVEQKFISNKTNIFLFSDDIEWCKTHLNFPYSTVYVEGDAHCPELDMWLMSYCNHNIISNSTFSWWGAWLNKNSDKVVVAPQKWFANGMECDIQAESWVLQ